MPLVLDADALRPEVVARVRDKPFIGTPHAGEFDRIAPALFTDGNFTASQGVLVLKGPLTRVTDGKTIYHSPIWRPGAGPRGQRGHSGRADRWVVGAVARPSRPGGVPGGGLARAGGRFVGSQPRAGCHRDFGNPRAARAGAHLLNMSDTLSERQAFMVLNDLPNIGPVTLHRLLEEFGADPRDILAAPKRRLESVRGVGPETSDALGQLAHALSTSPARRSGWRRPARPSSRRATRVIRNCSRKSTTRRSGSTGRVTTCSASRTSRWSAAGARRFTASRSPRNSAPISPGSVSAS